MGVRKKTGARALRFHGFTLVELIVVITILAILATIGFLALSGYSQDAKDSAIKANVRSVQSAISAEAAISNNSPRYYIVHDSAAALSGAFVFVDGNQTALTGWDWNVSDTNYSAGNPDYAKLKLNPEKFKVSLSPGSPFELAFSAYDTKKLTVGAVDFSRKSNGKNRTDSWFQVVAVPPTGGTVTVSGTFPAGISGSVAGLVRDPAGSVSDPLVEGARVGTPTGCAATTVNGYSVPVIAHAGSAAVSKPVLSGTGLIIGTKAGTATCAIGTFSVTENSIACVLGYVEGSALTCVADVCGGTISDANAHSTATIQTVMQNWGRSATASACTWDCNTGYGWDSATSSCKVSVNGTCGTAAKTYPYVDSSFGADTYCSQGNASSAPAFPTAGSSATWTCNGLWNGTNSATCTATHSNPANCAASIQTVNGRSYSVGAFNHGATVSANSSSAVTGGSRAYSQNFSCANGAVSTSGAESAGSVTCSAAGYALIGGSCVPNSCNVIKIAGYSVGDGTYSIDPDGAAGIAAFNVLCDMTTDGGGWTVFQERYSGAQDFYLGWTSYVNGFWTSGSAEHWLGLTKLNAIAGTNKELYVAMTRNTGTTAYAKYSAFNVWAAATNFTLSVSWYSGTAGDSLTWHSGYQFSTYDADHDVTPANCAVSYHGAWWYSACHSSNLNGYYYNGPHATYADGVDWYAWLGHYEAVSRTRMMVR